MALGYARFGSYDSVGYVLTLHIFPPYNHTICHETATLAARFRLSGSISDLRPEIAPGDPLRLSRSE